MEWVVVLVMATIAGTIGAISLDYSCNPIGSITVLNPNTTAYQSAAAEMADGSQNCSVLTTFLATTFVITNCPISNDIHFYLANTVGSVPEILTSAVSYHTIRCQQIPATGVWRRVTDESWVTNYISTSMVPFVYPEIDLGTHIEDIQTGFLRTYAIVGEPLRWEINVTEGYIALPVNCTVQSGAYDEIMNFVLNGCSLDTYLLHHFDYDSPTNRKTLVAKLFAFRFASSKKILIDCQMRGCKDENETNCDFTCPDLRKRSARDDEHLPFEQRSSRVNADSDQFEYHLRFGIDVYEKDEYEQLMGGTASLNASIRSAMLTCIILVFLWIVELYG